LKKKTVNIYPEDTTSNKVSVVPKKENFFLGIGSGGEDMSKELALFLQMGG
jgi:hypothetical protein